MSSQTTTTNSRHQPRRPRTRVESSGSETSLPDLDLTITVHNNSPASEQPAVAQPERQVATLAPPPTMPVLVISDSENEEDENNRRRRRRVEVPLLRLPTTPSQTAAATTTAAAADADDDDDEEEDMYEAVDSSILPENERNIFLEIEKKAEYYYCGICFGLCKEPVTLPCRHMFCAGYDFFLSRLFYI